MINTSPQVSLDVQPKDTKNADTGFMAAMGDVLTTYRQAKTASVANIIAHRQLLDRLTNDFERLDFQALAFPEVVQLRKKLAAAVPGSEQAESIQDEINSYKVNTKHYLVISIENALKIAEKNRWGLCKNQDFIYLYNGAFWAEIEKDTFQMFLGEAAEKMGVPVFSARFYQFREQLYKQFVATAYLPTPEVDAGKVLINLRNGTFEITPGGTNLRQYDRADFLTYQLPFDYDPAAKAPIFQAYLDRVLPDLERQRVLAEYLGFVFVKNGSNALKEEKALILYGSGANGKSVFFEVVTAMFGRENVSNYSLQSLTEEKGFYRAKISNKLVNYASEIKGKLEASLFKAMASGEPVEACLKYGQPFTMTDYAKFIFNCNELPKDVEQTNAFFRRFLIIPFDVTIPPEEQDRNLHSKIIENELSGVFNWVLDGLNRLLVQRGFSECNAAKVAVEKYRLESDSVQMFLAENEYSVSATAEVPLKNIFSNYRAYCAESGYHACSVKTFADRLRNARYTIERKNYGMAVNAKKNSLF